MDDESFYKYVDDLYNNLVGTNKIVVPAGIHNGQHVLLATENDKRGELCDSSKMCDARGHADGPQSVWCFHTHKDLGSYKIMERQDIKVVEANNYFNQKSVVKRTASKVVIPKNDERQIAIAKGSKLGVTITDSCLCTDIIPSGAFGEAGVVEQSKVLMVNDVKVSNKKQIQAEIDNATDIFTITVVQKSSPRARQPRSRTEPTKPSTKKAAETKKQKSILDFAVKSAPKKGRRKNILDTPVPEETVTPIYKRTVDPLLVEDIMKKREKGIEKQKIQAPSQGLVDVLSSSMHRKKTVKASAAEDDKVVREKIENSMLNKVVEKPKPKPKRKREPAARVEKRRLVEESDIEKEVTPKKKSAPKKSKSRSQTPALIPGIGLENSSQKLIFQLIKNLGDDNEAEATDMVKASTLSELNEIQRNAFIRTFSESNANMMLVKTTPLFKKLLRHNASAAALEIFRAVEESTDVDDAVPSLFNAVDFRNLKTPVIKILLLKLAHANKETRDLIQELLPKVFADGTLSNLLKKLKAKAAA